MNRLIELHSRKTVNTIHNPHFWAIALIICALIVFYISLYYWEASYIRITSWFPWLKEVIFFEFVYHMHGSFFFIPFLYAIVVFGWRGAIIVWLLCLVVILPRIVAISVDFESFMRNILFPLIPVMVFLFIIVQLKWVANQRKILLAREAERQIYMSQVLKAQEDERQRIARELHDDITQTLLAIANRAQALVLNDHPENASEVREHAEWIRDTSLGVSEDVRRLSLNLRPSILDDMGLVPALKWLVKRINQESGIDAQISVKGVSRRLGSEVDVNIFRIVQEALNNIKRHSGATEAIVNVDFAQGSLKITVRDNGRGFGLPKSIGDFAVAGKLGLSGIRERAKLLGATFDIQSKPGEGTTLTVEARV